MTRELSRTEKALRLIINEGITAKEAAEREGISPAAVSKGKLWPSKASQSVRKLCEMENEIESLRSEIAALTRQRDLAVEAIRHCIAAMGSVTDVKKAMDWPQLHNAQMLSLQALDAIKESEAK